MDIIKFSADQIYRTSKLLSGLEAIIEYPIDPDELIEPDVRRKLLKGLRDIIEQCEELNLSMSVRSADRLSDSIRSKKQYKELKGLFNELGVRIHDEIADNLFLFIPRTHAEFYEGQQLYGEKVEKAFPSSSYDIRESGKCVALYRGTACVFHCMRVLEHGLIALAKEFNVPTTHKAWGQIIDHIEKAIRKIPQNPNKPANWQEYRQFCSEAAAQFMHFKYAWRNYTAHARIKYTTEEAEQIFRHVGDFMKHLSKRLKEPATT